MYIGKDISEKLKLNSNLVVRWKVKVNLIKVQGCLFGKNTPNPKKKELGLPDIYLNIFTDKLAKKLASVKRERAKYL